MLKIIGRRGDIAHMVIGFHFFVQTVVEQLTVVLIIFTAVDIALLRTFEENLELNFPW
jgi:hypothetical protein